MIVDASAVLAVIFEEADRDAFRDALFSAVAKTMSAVNYFEAALRLDSMPDGDVADLDRLLAAANVAVVPATPAHARGALAAHRRFGKGRHAARLNMGDCFAYALAAEGDEALLFKGADFARTDVRAAL